jgi:hypothetical protein
LTVIEKSVILKSEEQSSDFGYFTKKGGDKYHFGFPEKVLDDSRERPKKTQGGDLGYENEVS